MRFYVSTLDNLDSKTPEAYHHFQEPLNPFTKDLKASYGFSKGSLKLDSYSSLSDCSQSDESKEDKNNLGNQSKHQMAIERRHKNFQVKKKTELCKTHQLGFVCPYGNKCSFAHGYEELRSKVLVPTNYKTVKCKQFFEKGYCNFGPRCQFLHKNPDPVEVNLTIQEYEPLFKSALQSFDNKIAEISQLNSQSYPLSKFPNMQSIGLRRLKVFEECNH